MNDSSYSWKPSAHTADLAIEITADDKPGLFHAALAGFLGSLELDTSLPEEKEIIENHLNISFDEMETAIVDFLNECIFLTEVEELVPLGIIDLKLEKNSMDATLQCREVTEEDRPEIGHIKAATYSDLQIENVDGVYKAKLIFDT